MLDSDLAQLYGVPTKQLKRAVRRNNGRFPHDFMFTLNKQEYDSLRRHFGTLKRGEHSKYSPMAFTEQGLAMLSSVLKSERAVAVNIQIMRIYVRMRQLIITHKDILAKIEKLEADVAKHDKRIVEIFQYIKELLEPKIRTRKEIGFQLPKKK